MKKLIALLLAMIMVLSMVACGAADAPVADAPAADDRKQCYDCSNRRKYS